MTVANWIHPIHPSMKYTCYISRNPTTLFHSVWGRAREVFINGMLQKLRSAAFTSASFPRPCRSNQYSKVPCYYTFRVHLHTKCHCGYKFPWKRTCVRRPFFFTFYLVFMHLLRKKSSEWFHSKIRQNWKRRKTKVCLNEYFYEYQTPAFYVNEIPLKKVGKIFRCLIYIVKMTQRSYFPFTINMFLQKHLPGNDRCVCVCV